ncbi:FAD-dependent oxidoreductase [Saccharomonospora xinjiangensis]|uniref:FAD-dependent oxidoreductase n=1 Tax=Saccharomonospora xinjiangensis TaxID=75294 RepID=UPI0002E53AAB|nr:FAD-dependent monooxygenase [Saccharomonospora xinjiangensis]
MEARIVGGGIGGLAAAAGLTLAGWRVHVYERADALADDGAGLGMWPRALRALDALGLGDELRRRAAPQQPGVIRTLDGGTLATIDTDRIRRRAGETVHVVARPDLLALLFESLPDGTVHFGEQAPYDVDADVVIGADGAQRRPPPPLRRAIRPSRHGADGVARCAGRPGRGGGGSLGARREVRLHAIDRRPHQLLRRTAGGLASR